ncbi:MAG TPA: hypothetical protein VK831_06055, partial [Candidatus Deferrimicrobiaceae bacterium]|nr:hypothetical protein [Candidatus Deferrimicrobiaceae bacterium]
PASAREIGALIEALRLAGRTVLAVTHDMELAARHFDRVVVLRDGRLVADGPPRVVFGAGRSAALAEAGVRMPFAARIAARLGLEPTPLSVGELIDQLGRRPSSYRSSGPG